MKIAVLCPTRDRPSGLIRLCQSVAQTSKASVLAYVDEDQADLYQGIEFPHLIRHQGPQVGPVASANALVETYPGYDVYGLITDDAYLTTPGWDEWVESVVTHMPNQVCVISPFHNYGNHVDMPFCSKEWINATGWFAYPRAFHYVWPIITGIIGEMSAIIHAPRDVFALYHEGEDHKYNATRARDAEAFFRFISLELPAVVERVRGAMMERTPNELVRG